MKNLLLAGVAGLTLSLATAAQAQEAPPQDAAAETGGLGEIVVTARRSSESLQAVPVAVTALSGDFIERQAIVSAADVPRFTPNLTIEQ
jgi:iron complex outermembrane receptor protein